MQKNAQVSFEFILIFAIVLFIVIPTLYLFKNYVYESNDRIVQGNIEKIANEIINSATEVYYRGVPSKIVVQVEMPEKIQKMFILEVNSQEHHIVFNVLTSNGQLELFYDSDVPLKRKDFITLENCYGSSSLCKLYHFADEDISPGIKNFRIESKNDGVYVENVHQ